MVCVDGVGGAGAGGCPYGLARCARLEHLIAACGREDEAGAGAGGASVEVLGP